MEKMWQQELCGVADIMRYEILYNYGGFCIDADSVCVNPLEAWLFDTDAFAVWENEHVRQGMIAVGYMGSIPGNQFFKNIIEDINQDPDITSGPAWFTTGPNRLTENWKKQQYPLTIWPSYLFIPQHFDNYEYNGRGKIFAKQIWGSTHQIYDTLYLKDKPMKIAIYTIAKNEEQHIDRWANSNKEADLRLVCDTGSNDQTVEKLKSHGVEVMSIAVTPWRFDVARNTALNLLPADVDICIWQDLDEELLPGWREELEKHWQCDATIANHKYRHNNNAWQWHSKIHARHNCHWVGPVHETLKWTIPEKAIWLNEFYLDEHQDVSKNRSNYLNLLIKKIKEGDRDWRTYYFLANDYQSVDVNESIKNRIESYNVCKNEDTVIKSYVARNIAKQLVDNQDFKEAEKWFIISINHSPERESWFYYADLLYKQQRWDECYVAIKKCISIENKRDGFTFDSYAWCFMVYDYAALSAYNTGLYKQAIEYGEEALKLQPDDQRLKTNLEFYKHRYEQS
jgi:hypothetical protein